MKWLKQYLAGLGPDSILVQTMLSAYALSKGFRLSITKNYISVRKGAREMRFGKSLYIQIPITMSLFDFYFETIVAKLDGSKELLDFSMPGLHQYRKSGVSLYFPGIPEDDVMDTYIAWHAPKQGDIVWDAGAHAGATSYFLSRMVGDTGKVYAFEPDNLAYEYLLKNIALHKLENVVPVKKALSGSTGVATFSMDGTMGAGIQDYVVYVDRQHLSSVQTLSIQDACAEMNCVPTYVKMDIEGSEIAAIEGSLDFLKSHPIHFAIETNHVVNDELTCVALEKLFPSIGYEVKTSSMFEQVFTWARPGQATTSPRKADPTEMTAVG